MATTLRTTRTSTTRPTPGAGRTRVGTRSRAPSRARPVVSADDSIKVVRACTIRRTAAELYAFWRRLENLQRVVKHPIEVTPTSATESHWVASGPPGDRRVEWDAVIITDQPGRLIAWRSREGADIAHAGSVHFAPAPADEGTEVTVELRYTPPGGKIGSLLAKLTGMEPGQQVADTLRRFKALIEAGEIPTIDGQPVGEPQRTRRRKEGGAR